MNINTIISNSGLIENLNLFPTTEISSIHGLLCFNDLIPLKVYELSHDYEKYKEIDLFNDANELVGVLYTPSEDYRVKKIHMTEAKFAAYLVDANEQSLINNELIIRSSYAIIKKEHFSWYLKRRHTSPLWGGYSHKPSITSIKKIRNLIRIPESIKLPTKTHYENSLKAIIEPYAFERFLKKYHLLELLSDWDIVNKLKMLNDDLYGVGLLLSSIDSNELNRLRLTLEGRLSSVDPIVNCLNSLHLSNYASKSFEIFQKYNKKGNTLEDVFFNEFFNLNAYDFLTVNANQTFRKSISNSDKHKKLIIDTVSYWIYRVRSSIAHQRIGEYIFSPKDENYICDFMEPIMDSILLAVFKT